MKKAKTYTRFGLGGVEVKKKELSFTVEMLDYLNQIAKNKKTSVSDLVRLACQELIDNNADLLIYREPEPQYRSFVFYTAKTDDYIYLKLKTTEIIDLNDAECYQYDNGQYQSNIILTDWKEVTSDTEFIECMEHERFQEDDGHTRVIETLDGSLYEVKRSYYSGSLGEVWKKLC